MLQSKLIVERVTMQDGTPIEVGAFTIIVGPNNGGKSRFLKDVAAAIEAPNNARIAVRDAVIVARPNLQAYVDDHVRDARIDNDGSLFLDALTPDMTESRTMRPNQQFFANLATDDRSKNQVLGILGFRSVAYLRTDSRLKLADRLSNKQSGIAGPQATVHAGKLASAETMRWLDDRVREAFPSYGVAVDDSEYAELRFALNTGSALSENYAERQRQLAAMRSVHGEGDGIRAFVGLLAAARTSERPIILIDEPEAFLHPPQAYVMGRAIAALRGEGHQIMVATHSADVLRGMLAGADDAQVLRMSSRNGVFSTRVLDTAMLKRIADDPVLSSVRVLDGLFYNAVAIVESDGDLVVYRRVLEHIDRSGTIHFVNSYAKQVSHKLAQPFHSIGVPSAVIVDFDALRVSDEFRQMVTGLGGDWAVIALDYAALVADIESADDPVERLNDTTTELHAVLASIDQDARSPQDILVSLRSTLGKVRDRASVWRELKREGKDKLTVEGKRLFGLIDNYSRTLGLFIVPVGEREAWLGAAVPYRANKQAWTTHALTYLGNHVLASGDPLHDFIADVAVFCR